MHSRIVTFRLADLTAEAYLVLAGEVAASFATWPGLASKIWIADHETNTYGGIYVFESKAAADLSRTTELFTAMQSNPNFLDLSIAEFDVLAEATAITGGSLATT